jgi:hypothetical protein
MQYGLNAVGYYLSAAGLVTLTALIILGARARSSLYQP